MNEITRIHIAKVAYDIEVNAKKELEKYIKSLETYTQDTEVLADIEIRMTELLAERKVAGGQVITSDDVAAIRKQLGEPYEFADEDGDIAVGAVHESDSSRRLYRSLDDAVLGGVLSGIAEYFKVNPLWTRLAFILLTFISFGLLIALYIILWIIIPAARTAAEKLQLAGKPVTLESIRALNASEENQSRSIAPVVRRGIAISLGIGSILAAVTTLALTIWGVVMVFTHDQLAKVTEGYIGAELPDSWIPWVLFWLVLIGLLLLTALFLVIAYAFLKQRLTKKLLITGIVIVGLGIASVVSVVTIGITQTARVSSEAQALMKTTKQNLPKDFSNVTSVVFDYPSKKQSETNYYVAVSSIQYIADSGTPRYELSALPSTKVNVRIEGQVAHVSYDVSSDYRNGYVYPNLIVYGPALESLETFGIQVNYSNTEPQEKLSATMSQALGNLTIDGTYKEVTVSGKGSVSLDSSTVQSLTVRSSQNLAVTAGTVRDLDITQSDVCPNTTFSDPASNVTVSGVTSGVMTYNGKQVDAKNYHSNCASVVVGKEDDSYNRYN
jgi:phage shock protein PspC (stress-responsive transcriptional regulator)